MSAKPLLIFDIDGTLTRVFNKNTDKSGLPTYAFWDLITERCVSRENQKALAQLCQEWSALTDKGTGAEFIKNSIDMLQASIDLFASDIQGKTLREHGKAITHLMIKQGIIRPGALEMFVASLDQGFVCVLSTGSYEDGALGFLDALIAARKLSPAQANQVLVSGATIDWQTRKVLHHNVGDNKIAGLVQTLKENPGDFQPRVQGVFVDDPLGNDSGLCQLLKDRPHLVTVVMHENNQQNREEFKHKYYTLLEAW